MSMSVGERERGRRRRRRDRILRRGERECVYEMDVMERNCDSKLVAIRINDQGGDQRSPCKGG